VPPRGHASVGPRSFPFDSVWMPRCTLWHRPSRPPVRDRIDSPASGFCAAGRIVEIDQAACPFTCRARIGNSLRIACAIERPRHDAASSALQRAYIA